MPTNISLQNVDANNAKHIKLCHPKHRNTFALFLEKSKEAGYPLWIYSSYRTIAHQQELYTTYLSGGSSIKAAKPGSSFHNFGLAIDVYVYNPKLQRFDRGSSYELYKIVASVASSLGIRWLGSQYNSERAHFDFYNVYKIDDLKYLYQHGLVDINGYVLLDRIKERVPQTITKKTENYSTEMGGDFLSEEEVIEEVPEKSPQRVISRVEKMKANGIWQIVKLVADQYSLSQYINDGSIAQSQGSLYNFIQNVVQEPWLQFFGDTVRDQYYFFCRKEPFDYNGWTVLPIEANIISNMVLDDDLKWYDGPVYSWYQIIPRGSFLGEQDLIFAYITAVFFEEYAEIFGSKPNIHVSNYINFGKELNKVTMNAKALADLRYMIESNAYLPFTRKGTISITGKSNIKRGYRIFYIPTNEVYYVESVSHRWGMTEGGPEYTTVLEVSRGMRKAFMIAPTDSTTKSYFNLINFQKAEPKTHKEKVQTGNFELRFFFDNDRTYLINLEEKFDNFGVDLKMVNTIDKFPNLRKQLVDINNRALDIAVSAIEAYHDAPEFTCTGFVDTDLPSTYKKLATGRAEHTKSLIIEAYLKKYSTLTRAQLDERIKTSFNASANSYSPVIDYDDKNQPIYNDNIIDELELKARQRYSAFSMSSYEKIVEKSEDGGEVGWKVNKEVFQFFLNRKQNAQ